MSTFMNLYTKRLTKKSLILKLLSNNFRIVTITSWKNVVINVTPPNKMLGYTFAFMMKFFSI